MFPGVGNCVSTPVFAVAGIISRPFPNGCLTTPCLIGQSVPLPLVQLQERRPQRLEVQLWPIFTRFLLQSFETPLKWEINLLFSRKHVLCGDATGTVFKWGNHLPENWIFFFKKKLFFLKIGQLHIEETGWCPSQVSPDVTSSVVFFCRFFFFFLPFALGATFRIERAETTFEDQPACCCQGAALVTTVHTSLRRVDFQH